MTGIATTIDLAALCTRTQRADDGIRYADETTRLSYPNTGNEECRQVEDDSFWFAHRNRCIVELVRTFPPGGPIVDIGAGNGFVARGLVDAGYPAIALEPGPEGAANARLRGLEHVVCATVESAGIPSRSMFAAGLFDVVEHIENDVGFLRGIRDRLRTGGRLYATVPAFQALWSSHDRHAGHYRRYSLGRFRSALHRAGFALEYGTYIFRPLPLGVFLFRALPFRLGFDATRPPTAATVSRDHAASSPRTSGLVRRLLASEVRMIRRRRRVGLGGSCLVVARRES